MAHVNGSIRMRGGDGTGRELGPHSFFGLGGGRGGRLSVRPSTRAEAETEDASTLRNGLELRNRPSVRKSLSRSASFTPSSSPRIKSWNVEEARRERITSAHATSRRRTNLTEE